jgi:hypothetical protein
VDYELGYRKRVVDWVGICPGLRCFAKLKINAGSVMTLALLFASESGDVVLRLGLTSESRSMALGATRGRGSLRLIRLG